MSSTSSTFHRIGKMKIIILSMPVNEYHSLRCLLWAGIVAIAMFPPRFVIFADKRCGFCAYRVYIYNWLQTMPVPPSPRTTTTPFNPSVQFAPEAADSNKMANNVTNYPRRVALLLIRGGNQAITINPAENKQLNVHERERARSIIGQFDSL